MRALVWKELRELRWAAAALVGCAVVIAVVQVLYSRGVYLEGEAAQSALLVWGLHERDSCFSWLEGRRLRGRIGREWCFLALGPRAVRGSGE